MNEDRFRIIGREMTPLGLRFIVEERVPRDMICFFPSQRLREDATAEEIESWQRQHGVIKNVSHTDTIDPENGSTP